MSDGESDFGTTPAGHPTDLPIAIPRISPPPSYDEVIRVFETTASAGHPADLPIAMPCVPPPSYEVAKSTPSATCPSYEEIEGGGYTRNPPLNDEAIAVGVDQDEENGGENREAGETMCQVWVIHNQDGLTVAVSGETDHSLARPLSTKIRVMSKHESPKLSRKKWYDCLWSAICCLIMSTSKRWKEFKSKVTSKWTGVKVRCSDSRNSAKIRCTNGFNKFRNSASACCQKCSIKRPKCKKPECDDVCTGILWALVVFYFCGIPCMQIIAVAVFGFDSCPANYMVPVHQLVAAITVLVFAVFGAVCKRSNIIDTCGNECCCLILILIGLFFLGWTFYGCMLIYNLHIALVDEEKEIDCNESLLRLSCAYITLQIIPLALIFGAGTALQIKKKNWR